MITKTENELKVDALDYAMKNKIVNEKAIKAYINGYKMCETNLTKEFMLSHIFNVWNHSDDYIKTTSGTHGAYSGWEAEKRERLKLEKQRDVALKVKEALDILKTIK
jgi:hypothetical protein